MGRCIDLLTLCFSQPCLNKEGPYAKIQKVPNYKKDRISRSKGNVNLTDVWYAMLDSYMEQDMAYICQYIDLLSDEDSDWWDRQIKECRKWICLGFFKYNRENDNSMTILSMFKQEFKEGKYFWTFGNADFIYAFSGENENQILEIIEFLENLDESQNVFFSKNYLYGICRQTEEEHWIIKNYTLYEKNGCRKHALYEDGKCMEVIKDLRKKICVNRDHKNKKMMAYYQALGQIVGILAQYEQKKVYKDLFYIFFPPISLFMNQLNQAEREIGESIDVMKREYGGDFEYGDSIIQNREIYHRRKKVEQSISEFIDTSELLLHHMGHTCRDILSDVGRGGIPFDIPLHLCLMYVAFLNEYSYVLNDSYFQYEYCLAPLAYSRPTTKCFDFGLNPTDRLIRVQISKHMMFMPRSLLIILAHEASHYVSTNLRARELRAKCLLKMINLIAVHRLIPENIVQKLCASPDLNDYVKCLREKIHNYFEDTVWLNWSMEEKTESDLHLGNLVAGLERFYKEIFEDRDQILNWMIEELDPKIVERFRNSEETDGWIQDLIRIQEAIKARLLILWADDVLSGFLDSICENLKEIYADISAICVLDLDPDVFLESYVISESYIPAEDVVTPALINRIGLVKLILEEERPEWRDWGEETTLMCSGINLSDRSEIDSFLAFVKANVDDYLMEYKKQDTESPDGAAESPPFLEETVGDLYYFRDIIDLEKEYFKECYSRIKKFIMTGSEDKPDRQERREGLKQLLSHFRVVNVGEDTTFKNFFVDYNRMVHNFKKTLDKNLEISKV